MAEGRLTTKNGEVFVFCDDNLTSPSAITMKDAIASVHQLQSNVNSKLTEIVKQEKGETGNIKKRETTENNEGIN